MKNEDTVTFKEAYELLIDRVHKEAFPGPQRDADDVGILMKKMFVNKLAREAFTAGFEAGLSAPVNGVFRAKRKP